MGTNENINGLVCQYLLKGTDLSIYGQEQSDAIADEIIERPGTGLGVRSSLSVYCGLLINSPQLHPYPLTPRVLHFTFESAMFCFITILKRGSHDFY